MKFIDQSLIRSFSIAVILMSPVMAKDAAGGKDHPILKRIEGSEIIWSKVAKFNEMSISLERIEFDSEAQKFKPSKKEKAEGEQTTLYYKLPGETSTLEAVRQYEADLKPAGYETIFTAENDKLDDGYNRFATETYPITKSVDALNYLHEFNHTEKRYMALKGQGKSGNTIYVTLYAFVLQDVSVGFDEIRDQHKLAKGQTLVRVDVLETKAMAARMTVVKADEITQSIEKTGRIAIYGVLFDTDQAELKPDSADSLAEMAKAIKESVGQKFLIVGHTDNVGDFAHNQVLSQKRATAVTAELTVKYQIPAASMFAVGVGMAAPVAPNTEEAGRTKNRRVEIVAM
jgi:OmpA-OmpF porin, OOP family